MNIIPFLEMEISKFSLEYGLCSRGILLFNISHQRFQKSNKMISLAINECPQDVYTIVHDMKISQINKKY